MKSKTDKFLIIAVIFIPLAVLAVAGACLGYSDNKNNNIASASIASAVASIDTVDSKQQEVIATVPDSMNLDVPFIVQAPFGLWAKYPFNHTCEEASVLMLHYI